MIQQKIQARAQILAKIFYLFFAMYLFVVLFVFVSFLFPTLQQNIQLSEPSTGYVFNLLTWSSTSGQTTESMRMTYLLITFVLNAAMVSSIFYRIAHLFQTIAEGKPIFDLSIIKQLKKISLWLYLYALVPMFLFPLLSYFLTQSFHFELGISNSLLFALGTSLLIEIFKYGASLQHEVNETV